MKYTRRGFHFPFTESFKKFRDSEVGGVVVRSFRRHPGQAPSEMLDSGTVVGLPPFLGRLVVPHSEPNEGSNGPGAASRTNKRENPDGITNRPLTELDSADLTIHEVVLQPSWCIPPVGVRKVHACSWRAKYVFNFLGEFQICLLASYED